LGFLEGGKRMASDNSQDTRLGRLTTPLGEDVLSLLEFSGTESINDLFSFTVMAQGQDGAAVIDFDNVLGTHFSVDVESYNGTKRWFDGMVVAAEHSGTVTEGDTFYHRYTFDLRPWFWFLKRRINSRIFHQKTVVDILEDVMSKHGFSKYQKKLSKSYPVLEYTVQYRESDHDFLCRLMEEYGINYHFFMEKDAHTLVMTDDNDQFGPLPGNTRPYHPFSDHVGSGEFFWEWASQRRVTTGAVRLMDYNFEDPRAKMEETAKTVQPPEHDHGGLESYDYPGRYIKGADGEKLAERRLAAYAAQRAGYETAGNVLSLAAGLTVHLSGHGSDLDVGYVALRCSHRYTSDGYRSGGGDGDGYEGRYTLVKLDAPLAPARKTPRSLVNGPQTAVVIADNSDPGEISCDKYGRIKVMFHWDKPGQAGSMWCRVSQSWAGKNWGAIHIPRVGMEVVVEFLEGDPDRPLVTGAVYNKDNMPPFPLPGDKTISGIKSRSVDANGYNSLTFEDKKDKEVIDMHAQKDLKVLVENEETREVKGDRKVEIKKSDTLTVTKDLMIESKQKITLKVGESTIVMEGAKITIKSPEIKIEAGMKLSTKGLDVKHEASAKMEINGGAMLDAKAILVKINS
jgi:type VI secretion system secreted protein VgrG